MKKILTASLLLLVVKSDVKSDPLMIPAQQIFCHPSLPITPLLESPDEFLNEAKYVRETIIDIGRRRFRMTPNVVKNDANIYVHIDKKGPADLLIFDMYGREMKRIKANLVAGENRISIPLGNLPPGQYELFGMIKDEKLGVIRFVKE